MFDFFLKGKKSIQNSKSEFAKIGYVNIAVVSKNLFDSKTMNASLMTSTENSLRTVLEVETHRENVTFEFRISTVSF